MAEVKTDIEAAKNRVDSSIEILEKKVKDLTDASIDLRDQVHPISHRLNMLDLKFNQTSEGLTILVGTVLVIRETLEKYRDVMILPPPPPSTFRIKEEIDFESIPYAIPMSRADREATADI